MPNPLERIRSYFRGEDLAAPPFAPAGLKQIPPQPLPPRDPQTMPISVDGSMVNNLRTGQTWSLADGSWPGWGTGGYGSGWGTYGIDTNSAVFACLMALSLGHIEPPIKVLRKVPGEENPTWLEDSPLQGLLDDPNPVHDPLELWFWCQWARNCDGNAYLRKIRSGDELTGNVVELWPLSPQLCKPYTLPNSSKFIDWYQYTPSGQYGMAGPPERIPPENIIHFRIGIDDRDQRLGLAPIKRLVREIASDEEATRFADALLRNFGVPGLVVTTPVDGPTLTEQEALDLKARVATSFGTSNRGNVGVLTAGAKMEQFGFSPEQLNLSSLHGVPETRICAVFGVHPAVAMMTVGLVQTANYASLKAVYEAFTERKLVPTWAMDDSKLNKQLRPDFTPDKNVILRHDLSNVRSLQEDMDAKYKRLDDAVAGFWIKPSEARVAVGYPEDPQLDALWLARAMGLGAAAPPPLAKDRALRRFKDMSDVKRFPEMFQAMLQAAEPDLQA
ncbi:MAG TPA: phage portal protein, partial [Methylomirabilota bacterium]|nr:phage portal protein [Methylomirabilota bacterium]